MSLFDVVVPTRNQTTSRNEHEQFISLFLSRWNFIHDCIDAYCLYGFGKKRDAIGVHFIGNKCNFKNYHV